MTTNNTTGDNECQRMTRSGTTNEDEWKRMRAWRYNTKLIILNLKYNAKFSIISSWWEQVKGSDFGFRMKQYAMYYYNIFSDIDYLKIGKFMTYFIIFSI